MIKEDCEIFTFDDCFKRNGVLIDRDHPLVKGMENDRRRA